MASGKAIPRFSERGWSGSAREFGQDRLALLRRVANECGDIGLFHAWGRPIVLLNKAEYVHAVLNEYADAFDLPAVPPAVRAALGQGPFITGTQNGKHKEQRKLVQPAFRSQSINRFADVIVECAGQVEQTWKDTQTVSIQREWERITAAVAGEIFFGADLRSEVRELSATVAILLDLLESEMRRLLNWPLWIPTFHNRMVGKGVERLNRIINEVIDKRRQHKSGGEDFLSVLLAARYENGEPLTEVEVRDHATIILLSGYDEMAVALTWTCWLLARHPGIYDRLVNEVDRVLGGARPSTADLERLPYTLQVFKEALRLYGPADILKPRIALRGVELDGYRICRGMRVIVSPFLLHRKPEYFSNPESFEPDRFAPANEKQIPRHAYFPFGSGQHACIGKHFALFEGHLLLAAISQRVRFELVEGQDIQPRAVYALRPRTDMKMVVNRNRAYTSKNFSERNAQPSASRQ